MRLYPLAGQRFNETQARELDGFRQLGVNIDYSGNVKFMQVPIVGDSEFIKEWVEAKMGIIKKVRDLGDDEALRARATLVESGGRQKLGSLYPR